jgi:hypothetical protein
MGAPATASRAEAHLWLLLEEALVAVGRAGQDVWEVQRQFRYVTDALLAVGVIRPPVALHLRHQLDDALVVRRLIPPASFADVDRDLSASADDVADAAEADASIWLEAELERHLDLLASYDPTTDPQAGAEAMRILTGPVRALEAAGALGAAKPLVADFATSIAAAGFDPGSHHPPTNESGRVRREWVRFLRDRPGPWPDLPQPAEVRHPKLLLGHLCHRAVRIDELSWSEVEVGVRLTLHPVGQATIDVAGRVPWSMRVIDDRGRLHLGHPLPPIALGPSGPGFRLRPGLAAGVQRVDVRITAQGARLEGSIPL